MRWEVLYLQKEIIEIRLHSSEREKWTSHASTHNCIISTLATSTLCVAPGFRNRQDISKYILVQTYLIKIVCGWMVEVYGKTSYKVKSSFNLTNW